MTTLSSTASTARARAAVAAAVKQADRAYNNKQANGDTTPVLFMDEADRVVSLLRQKLANDAKLDPARVGRAIKHLAQGEFHSTFNASRSSFNPFLRQLEKEAGLASRSLGTIPSRDIGY